MKKYTMMGAVLAGLFFSVNVNAELYVETGFEGGGDEIIGIPGGDSLNAGGGIKFAAGIQSFINEDETQSVRLAVGYLFDSIDAYDGDAELNTITVDAMYVFNSGAHSFGIGGTMHSSPEFTINLYGYGSATVEFDDAFGLMLEYGYHPFNEGMVVGARYTDLEYEFNGVSGDASSFGLFISNGF